MIGRRQTHTIQRGYQASQIDDMQEARQRGAHVGPFGGGRNTPRRTTSRPNTLTHRAFAMTHASCLNATTASWSPSQFGLHWYPPPSTLPCSCARRSRSRASSEKPAAHARWPAGNANRASRCVKIVSRKSPLVVEYAPVRICAQTACRYAQPQLSAEREGLGCAWGGGRRHATHVREGKVQGERGEGGEGKERARAPDTSSPRCRRSRTWLRRRRAALVAAAALVVSEPPALRLPFSRQDALVSIPRTLETVCEHSQRWPSVAAPGATKN